MGEGPSMNIELVEIDPDNLKRDFTSPAVRGLLDLGYTSGAAFLHQSARDAPPRLMLVMNPPARRAAGTTSDTSKTSQRLLAAILVTQWVLLFTLVALAIVLSGAL